MKDGIKGTTIHAALKHRFGYTGSYSAVRRFVRGLHEQRPELTTVLTFDPGEAAQVDFGQGPCQPHPHNPELICPPPKDGYPPGCDC